LTFIRGSESRVNRKTVITNHEFQQLLNRANQIQDEFLRKRALALLCVLRLTGKRREEVARLELEDVKVEDAYLNLRFTLEKKRKGTILTRQATKKVPLTDPLTKLILDYLEHLNNLKPKPKYFFPRVKSVFGYPVIQADAHISGRQIFNIIRSLSDKVWCHLFRETVASDIIKQDNSIIAAFKVMRRLDLEDYRTGFRYLKRFAEDIIVREQTKESDIIKRSYFHPSFIKT